MSPQQRSLALDHLTIVDATPMALAEAAASVGCTGICVFLHAMPTLSLMPPYDLVTDAAARRRLKMRMDDLGLTLDLAYPFTLSGRTEVADFAPQFAAAAELEAKALNLLIYDRDPARRADRFAQFCDMAAGFDLRVALEFYPASQVRSLADALDMVVPLSRPGQVGINVDLLHLMRSGGTLAELAAAPEGAILFAQYADGPARRPQTEWEVEAASDRQLGGKGAFDLAGFARALPVACPSSVEIPRDAHVRAGISQLDRAREAIKSVREYISEV